MSARGFNKTVLLALLIYRFIQSESQAQSSIPCNPWRDLSIYFYGHAGHLLRASQFGRFHSDLCSFEFCHWGLLQSCYLHSGTQLSFPSERLTVPFSYSWACSPPGFLVFSREVFTLFGKFLLLLSSWLAADVVLQGIVFKRAPNRPIMYGRHVPAEGRAGMLRVGQRQRPRRRLHRRFWP